MKTKITLIGARLSLNLGGPSLLAATKTVLDACFENPEYTLIIPHKTLKLDKDLAPRYGVKILPFKPKIWTIPMVLSRKLFRLLAGPKDQKDVIRNMEEADIIIDIWGIMNADALNDTFMYRLIVGLPLWMGKTLGKPVVKYTAALGPFQKKWNRFFARYYLGKKTDLILSRDETSEKDLQSLELKTPSFTVPDTAFLLEPLQSDLSGEIVNERKTRPVVCLSVSYQANNREKSPGSYSNSMVYLVNHIIKTYNAFVVLLPNELSDGPNDDTKIGQKILDKLDTKQCRLVNTDNLLAGETKGIINECDIVVAARYHSIVAALSLGLPTLAIAWHHKYREVLGLFEQQQWLCNIDELSDDELVEKFDSLWKEREKAKQLISSHVKEVKQKIQKGGELVYQEYKKYYA